MSSSSDDEDWGTALRPGPIARMFMPPPAGESPDRRCPMCGRAATAPEFDLLAHAKAMDAALHHIAFAVTPGNGLSGEGMAAEVRNALALHQLPRPASLPGFTVSHQGPGLCPVGCGGLTDDPRGGPCGACRETAR